MVVEYAQEVDFAINVSLISVGSLSAPIRVPCHPLLWFTSWHPSLSLLW